MNQALIPPPWPQCRSASSLPLSSRCQEQWWEGTSSLLQTPSPVPGPSWWLPPLLQRVHVGSSRQQTLSHWMPSTSTSASTVTSPLVSSVTVHVVFMISAHTHTHTQAGQIAWQTYLQSPSSFFSSVRAEKKQNALLTNWDEGTNTRICNSVLVN